ncbi:MAG: MBL fold metallo-hydrolase [Bacteroidetes bacterium]|nr:MBL fold metallo-hydrolase [Bacteroidota bacterium]MBU1115622.1 MBL fold metallo-hydrolase [Bacteroidota bacterium]MBU1797606.1 MBL fold metallo-hydrolase [Bacteroidota bacterium]
MKVIQLKQNPNVYCGNSYLLLGEWNTIKDINAIVDTGSDDYFISEIEKIFTGVGKNPVEKVILTHNHFDHIGGAKALKKKYNAKVYANILNENIVDYTIKDGDSINLAEHSFLVIHTPGHSSDSISLYCEKEQILFSGDTTLFIRDTNSSYTQDYFETIKKLSKLKIKVIYPGHGDPLNEHPEEIIKATLKNLRSCKILSN